MRIEFPPYYYTGGGVGAVAFASLSSGDHQKTVFRKRGGTATGRHGAVFNINKRVARLSLFMSGHQKAYRLPWYPQRGQR